MSDVNAPVKMKLTESSFKVVPMNLTFKEAALVHRLQEVIAAVELCEQLKTRLSVPLDKQYASNSEKYMAARQIIRLNLCELMWGQCEEFLYSHVVNLHIATDRTSGKKMLVFNHLRYGHGPRSLPTSTDHVQLTAGL